MTALRRIAPLAIPGPIERRPLGPWPELIWVGPCELLVDETYQRDLSKQSISLIKRMVREFAWNRMKPPVVVRVDGGLHIVDGQHTAIAAATLGIEQIPVFIVAGDTVDERARAFVGHNTDRVVVSAINIHRALLASGDPDEMDVDRVCRRAGVRIRAFNQLSAVQVGDTMAVGAIRKLIRRRGVMRARQVLEALVLAKRGPISASEILAADHVMASGRSLSAEKLSRVISIEGDRGLVAARSKAMAERLPVWRCLADRWLSRLQRGAA